MKTSCVILADIGNTRVTLGRAAGGRIVRGQGVPTSDLEPAQLRRALRRVAGGWPVAGAVLCSVVPRATEPWCTALAAVCGCAPLLVSHTLDLGLCLRYPRPETIGADRLANVCGAACRHGVPVAVADFGTALTIDVVSRDGAFVGGIIAPGPRLMTTYLAERTALLPDIGLPASRRLPPVGRSTRAALAIGARVGYTGLVRQLVGHVRKAYGADLAFCATGGYARWAVAGLELVVEPDLTLYGLSEIYRRHASGVGCEKL